MTRRRFLTLLFFALMTTAGALAASSRRLREYLLPRLKARLSNNPALDVSSSTGLLSEGEMKTILALAEALVPDVTMAKLDEQFFIEHVNHRTLNRNGYLKAYREGVGLLDEKTQGVFRQGEGFSALSLSEREVVLESLLWKYRRGQGIKIHLMQIFSPRRNLAFREFVVKDILQAVSRSSTLWAVVGYSHYPGVPAADPLEYTRPLDAANP